MSKTRTNIAKPPGGLRTFVAALIALLMTGFFGLPVRSQEPVEVEIARPPAPRTAVDEALEGDAPDFGGWETEQLSSAAGHQLHELQALLEAPGPVSARLLSPLLDEGFDCAPLRPERLETVFEDGLFVVRRPEQPPTAKSKRHRGAEGLARALAALSGGSGPRRVKFKVHQVAAGPRGFTTGVFFESIRRNQEQALQLNGEWRVEWIIDPQRPDTPRMRAIELEAYEEVEIRAPQGALFADVTRSALEPGGSYTTQFSSGIWHWTDRISRFEHASMFGHHGIAVGDVNGDGLDDLYVCDEGGLPNRLFVQNADGTVSDVSSAAGVDWLEHSTSALMLDLDNDGDQDLAVATYPRLLLAQNDGSGRFRVRARLLAADEAYALTAADYDADGDLDLYVTTYGGRGPGSVSDDLNQGGETARAPVPYHDANNGGANALLRNEGEFSFVEVTAEAGLDRNNARFSFAAAWEDYDDDGDIDLYVANDFGRNNLYRNDGGHFTDVAAEAGVEDIATGMSVSWGDYDRDGRPDLYVGNMYSGAGNRIAYQRKFGPNQSEEAIDLLRRTARGNSLFANAGDGTFRDISETTAVTMGRWAWSSNFTDLNNDGWLDLVVANGFISGPDTDDL